MLTKRLFSSLFGVLVIGCVGDAPSVDSTGSDSGSADASTDTTVADSAPADAAEAGCAQTFVTEVSEADTQILSSAPTQRWGTEDIMGARNDLGGTMTAIMRFDVTNVPTTATIASIRLDLPWAKLANNACGSTLCGSCTGVDAPGMIDVYYMRSDWPEGDATWGHRDETKQLSWGQAGATQNGTDRTSSPIGSFAHTAATDVSATLAAADLFATWRQGDKISFQVVAQSTTKFLIWTKEMKCTGQVAPKLTIGYCK